MWELLFLSIAAAILLAVEYVCRQKEARVLRHTISVNLSILDKELEELSAIADKSPTSDDVLQAKELLAYARGISEEAGARYSTTPRRHLGRMLGKVFGAMMASTRARHLLNACVPFSQLDFE